jgi:hypothetical protein
MKTPSQSAKSLRNAERRVREMPIGEWMKHIGLSDEEIAKMQAESAERFAAVGIK